MFVGRTLQVTKKMKPKRKSVRYIVFINTIFFGVFFYMVSFMDEDWFWREKPYEQGLPLFIMFFIYNVPALFPKFAESRIWWWIVIVALVILFAYSFSFLNSML